MIHYRAVAAMLLVSLFATGANAATFHKTTSEGRQVRVEGFANWGESCEGEAAPVEITSAPSHGSVLLGSGTVKVTRVDHGNDCSGHTFPATIVFYKPAKGFRGADQFTFTHTTRSGIRVNHDATVDVR